jgi:hypothetical protein
MSGRDFHPGPRSSTWRLQQGETQHEQSEYRAVTSTLPAS